MATEKRMPRKQPTQTTPKGAEIPIPKRGDFMRDLRKVASEQNTRAETVKDQVQPDAGEATT